ncbi:hypothetical protein ACH3XW_0165 [Acanthocheilonema viteae]
MATTAFQMKAKRIFEKCAYRNMKSQFCDASSIAAKKDMEIRPRRKEPKKEGPKGTRKVVREEDEDWDNLSELI